MPERVEFSVIGTAANEAARIESLTKSLDCHELASKAFVELTPEGWKSVGHHTLRGVGDEIKIFALSEGQVAKQTAGAYFPEHGFIGVKSPGFHSPDRCRCRNGMFAQTRFIVGARLEECDTEDRRNAIHR